MRDRSTILMTLSTGFILVSCLGCTKQKEAAPGPMYGGTARLPSWHNPSSLDPHDCQDVMCEEITQLIYEKLISNNPSDPKTINAELAEQWEPIGDGQTWRFHLRRNVTFHDDMCMTSHPAPQLSSDDVIASFERWLKKNPLRRVPIRGSAEFQNNGSATVEGLHVRDTNTLDIAFDVKARDIRTVLPSIGIMPKTCLEYYGKKISHHPVGTGPFRFASWDPGIEVILVRNEHYSGLDAAGRALPYLDQIRFSMAGNKGADFISGQLDLFNATNLLSQMPQLYGIPLKRFRADPGVITEFQAKGYQVATKRMFSILFLGFAFKTPTVFGKSEDLRRAIAAAINRPTYTTKLECDDPISNFFIPGALGGLEGTKNVRGDPRRALSIMRAAKIDPGTIPPIRFGTRIDDSGVARSFTSDMESIGLRVDWRQYPFPELLEKISSGELDVFRMRVPLDPTDPLGRSIGNEIFSAVYSGRRDSYFDGYSNQEFDTLYESANFEEDTGRRVSLYRQMNNFVIEKAIVIPLLAERCQATIAQPYVRNASLPHKFWWFDRKVPHENQH